MQLTLSKVKHLLLLFTMPRTLCSSQNNFPMRVTWLILIFSSLCLVLFLKWPSDASLPNPTLLYNCPSFRASRNWQKEIWSSQSPQPIFQGYRFFEVAVLLPTLTHSPAMILYTFFIFVDSFSLQNYNVLFLGVTLWHSGSERLSLAQGHTIYDLKQVATSLSF